MTVSIPITTILDTINLTAQHALIPAFPFRTYPFSSWVFIILGSLSYRYPVLVIAFVIYQLINSYQPKDPRMHGFVVDIVEFTIGYKLASTVQCSSASQKK